MCKPCLNKDINRAADIFCSTCNEFQCNECSKVHNLYAFMKNHKVLSVSEGPIAFVDKGVDEVDMEGLDICKKHNKRYKFFCEEDKALLCSTCAIIDHRACQKVAELESVAGESRCQVLSATLQKAITKTNQVVENLKEAESILIDDVQKIHDTLSKLRTNVIQMFDEFAEKVTGEVNSYRDQTTAGWAKRKLDCETKLNAMEKTLNTIDNVATNGTKAQQFIRAHSVTETIQTDVKNVDTLYADSGTLDVSCTFNSHFETLKSNLVSTISPGEFEMKYSVPKKTKLEPIASINLKQTGDGDKKPYYSGLAFLSYGRLVAVDNNNDRCLLYDANLNMKSTYKLPCYPLDVVAVSDNEVAITSGSSYRLDFLQVSKSNEITLNRTCKVSVKYFSICMKDVENFVVSTYDHDTPVRIVSTSGEEKDFDIVFPPKRYEADTSSCAYIRGLDKLVLVDTAADTVYIYDIKTGDVKVIVDELIKAPSGVTVGTEDRLFIGSKGTRSVVEITPAGRVLSAHTVDMDNPLFIAVSKDNKILALSNSAQGSRKLALYKILSE